MGVSILRKCAKSKRTFNKTSQQSENKPPRYDKKINQRWKNMTFELPKLEYEYDALEPYIDAQTMEIHHSKHHNAYTEKFNAALAKHPELYDKSAESIIADLNDVPQDIRMAVRNNGGGYINHKLFWEILKKDVAMPSELESAIIDAFGSIDEFKERFNNAAATQFGSGWAWLTTDSDGKLYVENSPNQDSPLTQGRIPILALDVWEHAYYLKYQNKRPAYIEAFWKVINWEKVYELYQNAQE